MSFLSYRVSADCAQLQPARRRAFEDLFCRTDSMALVPSYSRVIYSGDQRRWFAR